jgi:hypothetical protein
MVRVTGTLYMVRVTGTLDFLRRDFVGRCLSFCLFFKNNFRLVIVLPFRLGFMVSDYKSGKPIGKKD